MKKLILFISLILIPSVSCAKFISFSPWLYIVTDAVAIYLMNYRPPPPPYYAPVKYSENVDYATKGQWGNYWGLSGNVHVTNLNDYEWAEYTVRINAYARINKYC